jgi:hypothetical protein
MPGDTICHMPNAVYCQKGHYMGIQNPAQPAPRWVQSRMYQPATTPPPPVPSFCTSCGAPRLDTCLHCNSLIELSHGRPAYCGGCGRPFPWTEAALAAAREYADELEQLTADERTTLKATFDDLVCDTDRTALAVSRFKRIVAKVEPIAGGMLKKIVETLATEAAKKALGM